MGGASGTKQNKGKPAVIDSALRAAVDLTLQQEFELSAADIRPDRRLREDLDLDSLDAVDLLAALERTLKIRIDDDRAKVVRTVADLYTYVQEMRDF